MLLLGGRDGDGAIRKDSLLFEQCPGSCTAVAGPVFAQISSKSKIIPVPSGGAWIQGSATSDRELLFLDWVNGVPVLRLQAVLSTERNGAAPLGFESGVLLLSGGQSKAQTHQDIVMCYPNALSMSR